jgi:hypothetical protein
MREVALVRDDSDERSEHSNVEFGADGHSHRNEGDPFRYPRKDGDGRLPEWSARAHIDIELPSGNRRSYSLMNTSPRPTRRAKLGGSAFVHGLGDRITVRSPINSVALGLEQTTVLLQQAESG